MTRNGTAARIRCVNVEGGPPPRRRQTGVDTRSVRSPGRQWEHSTAKCLGFPNRRAKGQMFKRMPSVSTCSGWQKAWKAVLWKRVDRRMTEACHRQIRVARSVSRTRSTGRRRSRNLKGRGCLSLLTAPSAERGSSRRCLPWPFPGRVDVPCAEWCFILRRGFPLVERGDESIRKASGVPRATHRASLGNDGKLLLSRGCTNTPADKPTPASGRGQVLCRSSSLLAGRARGWWERASRNCW